MLDINVTDKVIGNAYCLFVNDKFQLYLEDEIDYKEELEKLLQNKNFFDAKFGSIKNLSIPNNGALKTIMLVGLGDEALLKKNKLESLGVKIQKAAEALRIQSLSIIPFCTKAAKRIAFGALYSSYKFDKYITKEENKKIYLTKVSFVIKDDGKFKISLEKNKLLMKAIFMARDIVNEPANAIYPISYAKIIKETLEPLGVKIEILDKKTLEHLKMGALLGVAQGSKMEPRVVIMHYHGGSKADPVVFAGKGVTFDSGGISLKPAQNLDEMKYDLGGSAAVFGVIYALALRKAKTNVIGIVGLVENMPDGGAQRPGDVVHSYSGKTIEVLNTDAEGRLVLADILEYAQDKFNPKVIIDLATLTGAIKVALGPVYAGLFTNDQELAEQLLLSSRKSNERVWQMPMDEEYDDMIKSKIADIANITTKGSGGGACTAAHFIKHFIKPNIKWAHLDIASVAWDRKAGGEIQKGAVGFGVRLLNKFIRKFYEEK